MHSDKVSTLSQKKKTDTPINVKNQLSFSYLSTLLN